MNEAHSDLAYAWSRLCETWAETQAGWNDDQRDQFESQVWAELEVSAACALRAMERLADAELRAALQSD